MSKDKNSGMRAAAGRMQDMAGGMMGMASAALMGSETGSFVENAAIGDLYEIEAARIALDRTRSDIIRGLAHHLLDDHSTSSHQLQSTLRSVDDAPTLPGAVDSRRAQMLDHLRNAPDEQFDQRFLEQQMMAHQESLTLFRGFAKGGEDPRLRLFAEATVPALERHIEAVRSAQRH